MEPLAKPTSVVKCEKHGLHYDSAKTSGCIVCRRESGELSAPRPAATAEARPSGSVGAALGVAAALVLVTTFAMQMVHTQFQEWLRNTGNSGAAEMGNTYQQKQMDGALQELREQGGPENP